MQKATTVGTPLASYSLKMIGGKMKSIILGTLTLAAVALAAEDKHIQMHEQMAKAHEKAAVCLKAGTSEKDCRAAFREMTKGMMNSDQCEHMKHHKEGWGRQGGDD